MKNQIDWSRVRSRVLSELRSLNRREQVVLGGLLAVLAAGAFLSLRDDSSKTTLVVERPTPAQGMNLLTEEGGGRGSFHARPRRVALRAAPLGGPRSAVPQLREMELRLPIGEEGCARLEAEIGGSCTGGNDLSPVPAGPVTVEWPAGGDVSVSTERMWNLAATPTSVSGRPTTTRSWTLQIDSLKTTVEFECIEASRFWLSYQGEVQSERCSYGSPRWTLKLVTRDRRVPTIFLAGADSLSGEAAGQEADLLVDSGELFAGGDKPDIREPRVPVSISSDRPQGVELTLDDEAASPTTIVFSASSASSVEVDSEQMLPSQLSHWSNFWFLLLGLFLGFAISIFLERLE